MRAAAVRESAAPPSGGAAPGPALVREVLEEYGALTREALEGYLPSLEPKRYLYDLLADYPRRGGKMMRPSICIAAGRAFGARLDEVVGSAAAIELLHNALLIHDDIEDLSMERRGKPALHVLHGVPIALNVGDALSLMSLRPLIENRWSIGPRLALAILEETDRMARESAEGQAIELGWIRDNVVDLDDADYFRMILKKTCWLAAIHPARVGAIIGSRGALGTDRFVRFGFFLGASFQIHDDVLNLTGDHGRYGKEIAGDLWEGKRTLILIHLLRSATREERARVRRVLAPTRERRDGDDVAWLAERVEHYDAVGYARQVAHGFAGAALHEFDRELGRLPESRDKGFLRALATWMFERTR